jgi:hypothetical protein
MYSIDVINSAADSTMSPDQRDLFDKFDDDTKQRFLNQIVKRSMRDEFAIAALKGCLANNNTLLDSEHVIAALAYRFADAMIVARNK